MKNTEKSINGFMLVFGVRNLVVLIHIFIEYIIIQFRFEIQLLSQFYAVFNARRAAPKKVTWHGTGRGRGEDL